VKQTKKFFDEAYFEDPSGGHKGNYTRVGGYGVYAQGNQWNKLADEIEAINPTAKYILDVGCAYGHLVRELIDRGYEAYGMDISEYAIKQALVEVNDRLVQGDISEKVPSIPAMHPRSKWSIVFSRDVLEHCETLDEARDILKAIAKKARFQLHYVNTGQHGYQAWGGDKSHGVQASLEEWRDMAEEVSKDIVIKEV